MSSGPLKVLILAEAANPDWTSVPLIGWSLSKAIASVHDAHLVTQIRNKSAIEGQGWTEGKEFTAIDSEKVAARLNNVSKWIRRGSQVGWTINTAIASIGYQYFERLCWAQFEDDLKAGKYDLVHRVTPVSPTAPSYIAKKLKKIGVPFVVGPLNGGVPWPKEFNTMRHKEREWLSYIRDAYKLLPGYRSLRKNASCLIAGSLATKEQMPSYTKDKLFYLPENGIDPSRFSPADTSGHSAPVKAVFIGRLVPYKGADMALEAIAPLCKKGLLTYDIFGSGPEKERLEKLAETLGISDFVTFHGFVENRELSRRLAISDILLFPSIREFGGGVVLEAMATGLVPVIVGYAGPAELVSEHTGFTIKIQPREGLINELRDVLQNICSHPETLQAKRQHAIATIEEFHTWDKRVSQITEAYKWVTGKGEKPHYPEPPWTCTGNSQEA